MVLREVLLVACYERRFICRDRLFWFFAIGTIGGIAFAEWFLQAGGGYTKWIDVALPSVVPLLNAWLFNVAQSVMVIFMGMSHVWRDRALETNVVFQARPFTNSAYVVGKMVGILEVFVLLNGVVMGIGMIVQLLFMEENACSPGMYLFYGLTLTMPTFVFMLGATVAIAHRVRHHAVAVLLLVGIFFGLYFCFVEVAYGVADPWGRWFPLMLSDVMGMVRPGSFLLHRGMYLMLGVGLISLSTGWMKRSDQGRWQRATVQWFGVVCLAVAIWMGLRYVSVYREMDARRQVYRGVYERYAAEGRVHVENHDIRFRQEGGKMFATSELVLKNEKHQTIREPVLYLNPGLKVVSLREEKGTCLPFERDGQALLLGREMASGEKMRLHIEYAGEVDEAVCYLDFSDESFHDTRLGFGRETHPVFRSGGCYARVGDDFTLLLPECLWYPMGAPPVAVKLLPSYDFTHYSLTVERVGTRKVISQGSAVTEGDGVRFVNRTPLPCLSLCMGDYEERSLTVDSLALEVNYFRGHDSFIRNYRTRGDTLVGLFQDIVSNLQQNNGGIYPFRKFAIVEIPAHFLAYERKGCRGSSHVLPERLYSVSYTGSSGNGQREDEDRSEREESEIRTNLNTWFLEGRYDVSPMFGEMRGVVVSDEYPGIQGLIALVLNANILSSAEFSRNSGDMGYEDGVEFWSGRRLQEVLNSRDLNSKDLQFLLNQKYRQIQVYLNALVGEAHLFSFVKDFVAGHAFERVDFEVFNREFRERFGMDAEPVFEQCYKEKELPVLFVRGMEMQRLEGEDGQVIGSCLVYNPSRVDGVVTINVGWKRVGEEFRKVEFNYVIPAQSCKRVSAWLESRCPLIVETNMCRNVPNRYRLNFKPDAIPLSTDRSTGIRDADSTVFLTRESGWVVDNEEEGFTVHEKRVRTKLGALFAKEEEKKYRRVSEYDRWTLVSDANCYGSVVKSAYCKKADQGDSHVEWKMRIEEPGKYEVYVYIPEVLSGRGRTFLPGARLFYEVGTKEGITEVELLLDYETPGWISLGEFDFDRGEYSVSLSDRRERKRLIQGEREQRQDELLIFADAVKWERRDGS